MLGSSISRCILFLGILILCSCSKEDTARYDNYFISPVEPSLVDENHVSEGLIVSGENGELFHFFRYDKGITGNHTGNNGSIAMRTSENDGKTWNSIKIIYNDEYDDRNLRGGIYKNGEIILFFRRYDASSNSSIDLNYITSYDNGESWTSRKTLNFDLDNVPEVWIDNFIEIGESKYLLPVHGVGYCELWYLGLEKGIVKLYDKIWEWNYIGKEDMLIDEPMFTYIGNNRIIGLFRNESKNKKSNYLQVISDDNGNSWTEPSLTNICTPFFSPSPMIVYDRSVDKLIVVGTDRRLEKNGNYKPENSEIFVYINDASDVWEQPQNFSLISKFVRPTPNSFRLYGYPSYGKISPGKYVIVFTESYLDNGLEEADFYQFNISITN